MSMSDELARLHELHRTGGLSDQEFAAAKERVIGSGGGGGADAAASGVGAAVKAVNALRRPLSGRWLGGVCIGLASATGLDTWVWRLLFVLVALCGGAGVLLYILLWIFVPSE